MGMGMQALLTGPLLAEGSVAIASPWGRELTARAARADELLHAVAVAVAVGEEDRAVLGVEFNSVAVAVVVGSGVAVLCFAGIDVGIAVVAVTVAFRAGRGRACCRRRSWPFRRRRR